MRFHPRRVSVDPNNPRAWGTSDRNGMISNHKNLVWQHDWAGQRIINKRMLVSVDELDKPQRQLGTIVLPADPVSIKNARVEPYAIDEAYTYTNLMMRMDVDLEDGASPPNVITNNGVTLVTTPTKFGLGSAYFDGASYFSMPTQDYFNPTGDFGIDVWVYTSSASGTQCIISKDNASGYGPYYLGVANGQYIFNLSSNGTSWDIVQNASLGNVVVNRWTHLVIESVCDIVYSFRDGFLQANFANSTALTTNTADFVIGRSNSGTDYFTGYMSYVRMSGSVGFWVSDFTPPDQFDYTL